MDKWGSAYWSDVLERVLSTLIYGVITLITTVNVTSLTWEQAWPVVVLPTVLSFLKAILSNLPDTSLPTASLTRVSSQKTAKTGGGDQRGVFEANTVWVILGIVGIVLIVLVLVGRL